MRIKKVALFLVVLFILVSISGCGLFNTKKTINCEIGKTYSTMWFDFTVHSIDKVDSYAGYEPAAGYQLYDVLITVKNTFSTIIPTGTWDFFMDDPIFYDYIWPLDPLDNTMMPTDYDLLLDQSVQYHLVFEIPAGTTKLVFMFVEFYVGNNGSEKEGDSFILPVE